VNILFLVLAAVLTFLVLLQVAAIIRARMRKGTPAPDVAGPWQEAVRAGRTVGLYFMSPTCSSCKVQTPIVDTLRTRGEEIYTVNLAEGLAPAQAFGVMGTPTVVVIKTGIVAEVLVGLRSAETLARAFGRPAPNTP
jgi:thiol-disulfide isomerase/thioredoxin